MFDERPDQFWQHLSAFSLLICDLPGNDKLNPVDIKN
jgi:hypothetical protein